MNNPAFFQQYLEACLTYWYWFPAIFVVVLGLNLALVKFFKKD